MCVCCSRGGYAWGVAVVSCAVRMDAEGGGAAAMLQVCTPLLLLRPPLSVFAALRRGSEGARREGRLTLGQGYLEVELEVIGIVFALKLSVLVLEEGAALKARSAEEEVGKA